MWLLWHRKYCQRWCIYQSRLCRFSYLSYKWTYGCSTECNGVSEYNEVTGLGWYTNWKKKNYLGGFGAKEENIERRRGLLLYSPSVVSLKYWMTLLWKGSCPQMGIKIQVSFFPFKFVFVFFSSVSLFFSLSLLRDNRQIRIGHKDVQLDVLIYVYIVK